MQGLFFYQKVKAAVDPELKDELVGLMANGRFFSVEFTKRTDGSTRKMLARTGVHKELSGEGQHYNPLDYDLLPVWDVQKQAYRHVPLDSIHWVRANGKHWTPHREP